MVNGLFSIYRKAEHPGGGGPRIHLQVAVQA
ncbi:hypothetical protein NC652_032807 [Populus alba x Populus x berolinensis]|nr:hypothetical protein NC652_032807 [Populus alba x Populus x berolinensis]